MHRYDTEIAQGEVAAALVSAMKGTQMGPPIFNVIPRTLLERLTTAMMASEEKRAGSQDVTMRMLAPTLHYDFQLATEVEGALERFKGIRAEVLLLGGSKSPAYLHASLDQILWVLNGYSLAYAVLLITSGRLGDIFGPRNMFAAGIVVFTVASAFSGLAQDPTQLILARGLQGIGAAIIAPQGLPIMTTIFPPERRAGVFAIYGSLAGLAVLLGPVVGGFIVTNFGWRWIFYVNLPVGLLTFILAFVFVPDLRPGRRHRLDWAGVAIAPQPLAMMLMSGVAAALAARYAKYILITGLTLFAIGMAYIAWIAQVSSNRWSFLPGLVLGGIGMAGVWTPVFSMATRNLQPRLAGVASGVLSTIQELGAVIGSAAIGAVLQNQLAADLHNRAVSYSAQLPSQAQAPFVDGFSKAARSGLEVGRGQTGTSLSLPAGVPAQGAHQIQQLAHAVFTQAFVDAMRPTMALAIAVVLVAAVGAIAARNGTAGVPAHAVAETQQEPASVA